MYTFLAPLLERGASEVELAQARKIYRRAYQTNWRKQKRLGEKEFTISLTKDELVIITKASKNYHRSKSRFIKEAALAYLSKKYLVPDQVAVNQIRGLLTLNYTALQHLFEENTIPPAIGRELLARMADLEHKILIMLNNPPQV